MSRPNLFNYATSELSQDAFLAWLIEWGSLKNQLLDPHLNECAVSFIQHLLGKEKSFSIEEVKVWKQWKNIDVAAMVNGKYFLVIEDKKGSWDHSDQLNRYAKISRDVHKETDVEVVLNYFKMEEQGNYDTLKDSGFHRFERKTMLSILSDYMNNTEDSKRNNIVVDYYENLKELDRKIKSYKYLPLNKWGYYSWQGFYTKLQEELQTGSWNKVPNRSGGFMGFWWDWNYFDIEDNKFEFYLQLEEGQLVVKLHSYDSKMMRENRDYLKTLFYEKAKPLNINLWNAGAVRNNTVTTSVVKLASDYRVVKNDRIDIKATVGVLKSAMQLLEETSKELNNERVK